MPRGVPQSPALPRLNVCLACGLRCAGGSQGLPHASLPPSLSSQEQPQVQMGALTRIREGVPCLPASVSAEVTDIGLSPAVWLLYSKEFTAASPRPGGPSTGPGSGTHRTLGQWLSNKGQQWSSQDRGISVGGREGSEAPSVTTPCRQGFQETA